MQARTFLSLMLWACCANQGLAQEPVPGLAAAQQRIDAEEWQAALELLLGLAANATADAPSEDVARKLVEVGSRLQAVGDLQNALRANEAALQLFEALAAGRDHPHVATCLNNVAFCHRALGRAERALPCFERALAMRRRIHAGRDHREVASSLNNLAACMRSLGQTEKALPAFEEALAMTKRLFGDDDHPDVAGTLNNLAFCLQALGELGRALPLFEQALAMLIRLHGERDHPDVARSLSNVGFCRSALGQTQAALADFEQALAMTKRLYGDRDHALVAGGLNNTGLCLNRLGQTKEALPRFEQALAMHRRLYRDADHDDVVTDLTNIATSLMNIGRFDQALPRFEQALAMTKRLYGDRDHATVARSINAVASCLDELGQTHQALVRFEQAETMRRRLWGDRDHPDLASSLGSVANCLRALGRTDEALPRWQKALAMQRRIVGDLDHADVAASMNRVAYCLATLGKEGEALPLFEQALAMRRRLAGERDHAEVAHALNDLAYCLERLGDSKRALQLFEQAVSMRRRLHGDRDHPSLAGCLQNLGGCLAANGRLEDALRTTQLACGMIERLRDRSETSAELRRSMFDEMKRGGAFEQLQALCVAAGRSIEALDAAERSRARELLDLLEQQRFDPLVEAVRRAQLRGDTAEADRLRGLHDELEHLSLDSDRLLHELTRLDEGGLADEQVAVRRRELLAAAEQGSLRQRQLLDEQQRLLADVLPVGRVRPPAEIQAALHTDELLLEFTLSEMEGFVYVVPPTGEIRALPLPLIDSTLEQALDELLATLSTQAAGDGRGRDPAGASHAGPASVTRSRELFAKLIPKELWPRIRDARRVFVAAHRALHRLPFELLVVEVANDQPVYWLDAGPAISYVQSGNALAWLRDRAAAAHDDRTDLDLLAIGDPRRIDAEPEVPELGALVLGVHEDGEGARIGLLPRDVIVRYDDKPLADDASLRDLRTAIVAAIEDGQRPATPVAMEVWRRGETLRFEATPGLLGVDVGRGRARSAHEASLSSEVQLARITRAGDVSRLGQLPPLRGARAETDAIATVFATKGAKVTRLLDQAATEPAVFDLAAKARNLHFACHGIAEEYAGQSLSMLVLSQPMRVTPEDDGLLKLSDLLHRWRGRLASCRLVVLSACRTNVGPMYRDEAPRALPLGFLFAGASAVVSSLWAVDDSSTRELMTDFYGRMLAGEQDRLAALTAAKKALRKKYPDPFHWAPFLYLGSPE